MRSFVYVITLLFIHVFCDYFSDEFSGLCHYQSQKRDDCIQALKNKQMKNTHLRLKYNMNAIWTRQNSVQILGLLSINRLTDIWQENDEKLGNLCECKLIASTLADIEFGYYI